jgi:nucleolar protein 53
MGKRSKRGASLRAKKRANAAHQQLEQALTDQAEEGRVQSKKDEELFVLDTSRKDTAASNNAVAARRAADKEASRKRKCEHSDREKRKIEKVLKNHGKEGAIALAERGKARLNEKRIRKQITAGSTKPTFDLWDQPSPNTGGKKKGTTAVTSVDPTFDPPTQAAAKLSNKQIKARMNAQASAPPQMAVEVAHPGQSYRPDREHHQDAIGEALSIEIRRNEAEEYKAKPISEGMTSFTKEFIKASDDESTDEEEEDDDNSAAEESTKIIKRKEKLTRAQRNKQKRLKAEHTLLKERRQRKQFLHQANEVHIHNKVVKQAEKNQLERRKEVATFKLEKKSRPVGRDVWSTLSQKDPIRAPSLPVALTEELQKNGSGSGIGGGLRSVTPKGSLVTDRLESMVARKLITKKKQEGRRIVQGKRRPKVRGSKDAEYLLV